MDEQERMNLVTDHHRRAREKLPNEQLHAVIHTIVENQVAMGDEVGTGATLDRLMRQGLDRHEVIHAIGNVLSEFLYDFAGQDDAPLDANNRYENALKRLTAAAWLKDYSGEEGT